MSLIIAVHVDEGIVLAADRRTTYTNTTKEGGKVIERVGIHTTNTTEKLFMCPNGAGIATCGDASANGKPITGTIKDFIRSKIKTTTPIENMPQMIIDHFKENGMTIDTNFLIGGYSDHKKQSIYKVRTKARYIERINTDGPGAVWDGETSTLSRLIMNVAIINPDGTHSPLPFEKVIWNYLTLQDALDFARYAVDVTIQTMRFKNVIETVGGGTDIMLITPDEIKWIQKKEPQ